MGVTYYMILCWDALYLGFTEKEFDDMKGIFLDTNFVLFGLTVFISVFHVRTQVNQSCYMFMTLCRVV